MALIEKPVKMKHGTATKIATQFRVSVQHVSRIAKGERMGRKALVNAILREAERYEQGNAA